MFAAIVLLSGCIQKAEITPFIESKQLKNAVVDITYSSKCVAMSCQQKKESIFYSLLSSIFDMDKPSLAGGACSFEHYDAANPKDTAKLNSLVKAGSEISDDKAKTYIRTAMIGFGDSIAAADEAQSRLCNGNLGFAVQNLGGYTSSNPRMPNTDAAECMLMSDVIPLFKFDSPISYDAAELGAKLSTKGPAIFAPGVGYSYNRNTGIADPSTHFAQIKGSCSNCITAAIVNFGDYSTLEYYGRVMSSIDIIGFTLDANNFTTCNVQSILSSRSILSVKNFSQDIFRKWGKPVIIIDAEARAGQNDVKSCEWSERMAADFYPQLIKALPDLTLSGVIGVGVKGFAAFDSKDCQAAFSDICTAYYTRRGPGLSFATPVLFSEIGDVSSSPCTESLFNNAILAYPSPVDYSKITIPTTKKAKPCGDSCFIISNYALGGSFQQTNCNHQYNSIVRDFAGKGDYDPTIVMAIIDKQFGYDAASIHVMSPAVQKCSCDAYSGHSKEICCGVQTLSYYYGEAKKSILSSATDYEYKLAYLSVYGYLKGDGFSSELDRVKSGGELNSIDVADVISRTHLVRSLCQICSQRQ